MASMVHDDESDVVRVDVARIPDPMHVALLPSKLSLLLLHKNDVQQSQTYIVALVDDSDNDRDSFESESVPNAHPLLVDRTYMSVYPAFV